MSPRSFVLSDETPTSFDRPGIYFPRRPNPPTSSSGLDKPEEALGQPAPETPDVPTESNPESET